MERKFITVEEASQITGLSVHSIRNRVSKGQFKTLPRNRNEKILIYRESILGKEDEHDR